MAGTIDPDFDERVRSIVREELALLLPAEVFRKLRRDQEKLRDSIDELDKRVGQLEERLNSP